jgi:transketolase
MTLTASSTPSRYSGKRRADPPSSSWTATSATALPTNKDTSAAHGEPLGDEEVRLCKRAYGWPEDAQFLVPDGVYEHFAEGIGARGAQARRQWTELLAAYRTRYPELAREIELMQRRELPDGWDRQPSSVSGGSEGCRPDAMRRARC